MAASPGDVTWGHAAAVASGAAIGAVARWLASQWLNPLAPLLPLGTLLVNCVGGLLIGASLVLFELAPHTTGRLFLVTGILGGFTTFSAFSAESLGLLQQGHVLAAAVHAMAHVLGALACTALGYAVARQMWPLA